MTLSRIPGQLVQFTYGAKAYVTNLTGYPVNNVVDVNVHSIGAYLKTDTSCRSLRGEMIADIFLLDECLVEIYKDRTHFFFEDYPALYSNQ
jgi:hypothetical protein